MEIKRIIVAADFSKTSDHAIQYALGFAKQFGAKVDVVHVYQVPVYAMPEGGIVPSPETVGNLMDQAQGALNELMEKYKTSGVSLEGHLREGLPFDAINQMAEEMKADLIVMGTHGRTGINRVLLGSVAERVVRTSTVPVLIVPRDEEDE